MSKKETGRLQTANIPPFGLRMQPELKDRVERAAAAAGRSMNAEIVTRLQQSFASAPGRPMDDAVLWVQVRELTLQKDMLLAKLASHQAQAAQYDYQLRTSEPGFLTNEEAADLHESRAKANMAAYETSRSLDEVIRELDELHRQLPGMTPMG